MTLRKKTLLIIGLMLIGLIAMLYTVSQSVFLDSFSKLEKQDTSQNVERALGALSDDVSQLASTVGDWAPWDDTYNFVEDLDESYVQNNLNDATIANLGINFVLFVNSSGQLVYGKAFDLQNEEEIPVPQGLQEYLSASDHPASKFVTESSISGIILSTEVPMLIASHQIMTSEHKGPVRGALIMGRYLDSMELESLAETARLSLSVHRLDDTQMPADFEVARSALSENGAIFVKPLDSKSVAGYTLIKDIYGEPVLVLRADMPRVIYQQGQTSLIYFISLLVGVSLLFVVVVVVLLERFMLSPLSRLNASVREIGASESLSAQVAVRGRDELSSLGSEINKMLKALQRSQEAQRESELLATATIEGMADGVMLVNMEGKITYVNKAFEKLLGHKAGEVVGTSALELPTYRSSKDRERAREALKMLIEKGSAKAVDMTAITKDGEEIPISFNASLIKDAQGNSKILVAVLRDVTERRWAEEALRRSEEYFRALTENASDGVVVLNRDSTVRYESPSMERMLGRKPGEQVGKGLFEFAYPDDAVKIAEQFTQLVQSPGSTLHTEMRMLHEDGSWRVFEGVCKNLLDNQFVEGLVINARDITERKRMEEALKESEQRFRVVFENATDGILLAKLQSGAFVDGNRMISQMLGYSSEEIKTLSPVDIHPKENLAHVLGEFEKLARGEIQRTEDIPVKRKDGSIFYADISAYLITLDGGIYLTGVFRDITERRRAEEELRRLSDAVRMTTDSVAITDMRGRIVEINEAGLRMYGLRDRADFIGKNPLDAIAPEDRGKAIENMAKIMETGQVKDIEYHVLRKDGSRILIETSVSLIQGVEGKPKGLVAVARDITERRRMEEALRESEEYFRSLIENAQDAIVIVAGDGTISYGSPSIERMLGYRMEELVGADALFSFAHPDDIPKVVDTFTSFAKNGNVSGRVELRIRHKDGSWRVVEAVANNLLEDRAIKGIVVNWRDVTERKKAEESLKESEARYRLLAENVKDVISAIDMNLRTTYMSPSVIQLTGYSVEEAMALTLEESLTPASYEKLMRVFEERMAAETRGEKGLPTSLVLEVEAKHKDGHLVSVEMRVNLLRDAEGKPVGILGVTRDITERKKAEKALRESEEKFRSVAETASDAIVSLDSKGNVVFWNQAAEAIHGYPAEEILGKPFTLIMVLRPDDIYEKEVGGAVSSGERRAAGKTLEAVGRRKGGSEFPLEFTVAAWKSGDETYVTSISRDITERKRMEEALRESEEKLRLIFESITDGIVVTDLNGVIIEANEGAAQIGGFSSREAILGRGAFELIAPRYHEEAAVNLQKTLNQRSVMNMEYTLIRADGSEYPGELSAALLEDASGNPVGFVGVVRDITQRRKAEEALRVSEERYRLVVENASEAIVVAQDGVLKFSNSRTKGLFGYSQEEMASKPFIELIHPDDQQMVAGRYMARLRGEEMPSVYSFRVVDKARNFRWVEINAVVINWEGRPATLNFLIDITERKKAEEERLKLEEQLRLAGRLAAVGELSAGVAHELNNPLAAIQGFAQLLTARNDLDEATKKDLGIVYREAQRAAKITQNLLSFARRHEPEKRLISINEVLEKTLELRSHQMKVNNIEVVADFAADLPKTRADFFQMQQVFVNIINNAEQSMVEAHGKGRLVVKTQKVGNMIQATFADNGPGISEENLKRIFDPFFTTKEVGKGTGLGLSICYGIVEAHGGRIYARSKLGEGATFVVEIPIISEGQ